MANVEYIITSEQYEALNKSISIWTNLSDGKSVTDDDPMCKVGSCPCRIPNGTLRCVIDLDTGGKDCSGTPYQAFNDHVRDNHDELKENNTMQTFCPECIALARKNLNYLVNLISRCAVETDEQKLNVYNMGYANPEFALLWENLGYGMHKLRVAKIPSTISLPVSFTRAISAPIVQCTREFESNFKNANISIMCKSSGHTNFIHADDNMSTEEVTQCIDAMKKAYLRLLDIRKELHAPLKIGDKVTATNMYTEVYGCFSGFNGTIEQIKDDILTIGFKDEDYKIRINKQWAERVTQEYINNHDY